MTIMTITDNPSNNIEPQDEDIDVEKKEGLSLETDTLDFILESSELFLQGTDCDDYSCSCSSCCRRMGYEEYMRVALLG